MTTQDTILLGIRTKRHAGEYLDRLKRDYCINNLENESLSAKKKKYEFDETYPEDKWLILCEKHDIILENLEMIRDEIDIINNAYFSDIATDNRMDRL